MGNRIIYMVLAGLALYAWWWVGLHPYYAMEAGGIGTGYIMAAVIMLVLGSGSGDGDNPVEVIMGAITGSVSNLIAVGAAFVIGRAVHMAVSGGFDPMGLVHSLAIVVASGLLISISVACMRNSD